MQTELNPKSYTKNFWGLFYAEKTLLFSIAIIYAYA